MSGEYPVCDRDDQHYWRLLRPTWGARRYGGALVGGAVRCAGGRRNEGQWIVARKRGCSDGGRRRCEIPGGQGRTLQGEKEERKEGGGGGGGEGHQTSRCVAPIDPARAALHDCGRVTLLQDLCQPLLAVVCLPRLNEGVASLTRFTSPREDLVRQPGSSWAVKSDTIMSHGGTSFKSSFQDRATDVIKAHLPKHEAEAMPGLGEKQTGSIRHEQSRGT
ncbi:predicted protein [Verticillium alfalfae VaMs.102]|uniref:Predicted protein n=1 Tax=Verticillium alfalfae (strain VaMs.102 / ATCC MYA-4576 / FGSC 10136) TaxID=526221 RepID=C9S5L9_VERA1|nr:predicted protein [Verticillium alfalfae VaMs.102]EEY14245.1 predicted protein [Verticillium alfalfae VaMs.102]